MTKQAMINRAGQREIPQVDLRVRKRPLQRLPVQPTHPRLALIRSQPPDEQLAFRLGQEGGRLGPVHDDELGDNGEDDGGQAFDDEDPSPAAVAGRAVHVVDGVGEELPPRVRLGSSRFNGGVQWVVKG